MNTKLTFSLCLFFYNTFFASYLLPKTTLLNNSKSIETISAKLLSHTRNCSSSSSNNNNNFENIKSKINDKNLEKLFEEMLQEQKNQIKLFEKILHEQTRQRIILENNREEERSSFYSGYSNKTILAFICVSTFLTHLNTSSLKKSHQ